MLIIRHVGSTPEGRRFRVVRGSDGKQGGETALPDPRRVQTPGRPNSNLAQDLRWYLETFLDYPYSPNSETAERIVTTLKEWGEQCFLALFDAGEPRVWYTRAREQGLTLKISSDDPQVLAWPWEALRDPGAGVALAHDCQVERQLNERLQDPLPLPANLPRGVINVLLVIARPQEEDVGYHAVSRPLVALAKDQARPVTVEVLRPPTFDQLRRRLGEAPGHFHIVHFDGHGGFGEGGGAGPYQLRTPAQGRLVFENAEGGPDPISADQLTTLLREHRIPVMVLNACRSAMLDQTSDDPFASVAAALLRAGLRSVVAMGFNLYVSGAQQFVPAFYERLFKSGSVAEGVLAGRQAMFRQPARLCSRGEHPLQDWLIPILYQQDPLDLSFQAAAVEPAEQPVAELPPEARVASDYGFIGRERAILALERAVRRQPQGAILIHGMAGVGKTTLAQGFLEWLRDTGGLAGPVFWFDFRDIRSADYLFNRLVEALFGLNAVAAESAQKETALVQAFQEHPLLMVWDNFESASGIDGSSVAPLLPPEERARLAAFLKALRRAGSQPGRGKVLLTSRSPESWLTPQTCYRLPLGGLQGEERWAYCNAVVGDLGLTIPRHDPVYAQLLEELQGHPLALRAILLRLQQVRDPARLLAVLRQGLQGADGDESTQRIEAALALFDQGLDPAFAPTLQLIGLHQKFVDQDYLEAMLQSAGLAQAIPPLANCCSSLQAGGLLHPVEQNVYALHPALAGHLARRHPPSEAARRGFVEVVGNLAEGLTPLLLHQQRVPFLLHGSNIHAALVLAGELAMVKHLAVLTQALAYFFQNIRDFTNSHRLFEKLTEQFKAMEEEGFLAGAYHQLGIIAQEQRQWEAAERWYQLSLAIKERIGDECGVAGTYHQLGMIAQEQGREEDAGVWYRRSLAISVQPGNESVAACTYHNLGVITQGQEASAKWYIQLLAICESLDDEPGKAITYHQLGMIAQKQGQWDDAKRWYRHSLAIEKDLGNEHGAAITYHQLGMIAQQQGLWDVAEEMYRQALVIKEKRSGNKHGEAKSRAMLGLLERERGNLEVAGAWLIQAAQGFLASRDGQLFLAVCREFAQVVRAAAGAVQVALRQRWQVAGLSLETLDQLLDQLAREEQQAEAQPAPGP